jgi:hypothetical protein
MTLPDLPYFQTLGNIPKYFQKIHTAETPDKFDYKFLKEVLGFRSGNDQRLIPVLRSMNFIDSSGIPLKRYNDFRAEGIPSVAIAQGIRDAYQAIFTRNVNAHSSQEEEIKGYVISITGKSSDNALVRLITSSFNDLCKLGNFKDAEKKSPLTEEEKHNLPTIYTGNNSESKDIKLSYTIVLNLPATTTKEVYDTLFSSLKENLLKN